MLKEGHLKKNYDELKALIELRRLLREQKTQKNTYITDSNTEGNFSTDNSYITEFIEEPSKATATNKQNISDDSSKSEASIPTSEKKRNQ
ncbi:3330_t:CDS:2 [Scutellospora calospora]|uniref:3330_t:CDS:1 n=1 Tax=Scutellospora calospora TaxID=85575 RepID=A0ACA9KQD8_9GLOM|nr:3330_t:CDS:2 [Scutellospora calospora]